MQHHHPRAPFLFEEVVAYHGTSVHAAESIVDSQRIRVSDKPDEWLGRGAYFFQGSIHRARQWAKQRHKEQAAIVSARIRLGHCIDLLDNRWIPPVRVLEADLRRERGSKAPHNRGKYHALDCAVINRLADQWRPDTIRAAYLESINAPAEPGQMFQDATHIQISVRHPESSVIELNYDGGTL